ncbi:MAG: hypothetical protein M1825_003744 [Sarcosagium campestre]|nr:MAG: hypothetical protein M1825_003744 [Sarcosagium campestre]
MPPSCCGTVIPGTLIKDLLTPLEQQRFLETVLEYAVASGNQFVCTNLTCGNLIPRNSNLDPKNPFELACQQCGERICKQCSQEKHSTGDSCPFDWEVDALRQLGDDSVWRRCYRCANLVKLDPDSTHMSCSCDAKYCYLCGGIWDPVSGCPNSCNYDEDIQRRREAREEMKEREAKAAIERDMANAGSVLKALEATSRSAENEELQDLRSSHYEILDRFVSFEQKQKWLLWTRHGKMKSIMLVRQAISEAELKEQHKTAMTSLEDRQVAAEMDLRQTFLQERRACAVRLRHMEAYCSGYSAKNAVPPRVVTDRDLRELHQQYRVRDGMDQAHENRINVLREKQAQRLEALEARQMDELERLKQRSALELEAMSAAFASEEDHFKKVFDDRRSRLLSRWKLVDAIARKQLELETGLAYGPLSPIQWPNDIEKDESLTKEVGQGPLGTTTTPTRRSRRPTGARSRTAPPLRPSIDNFMLPASSPGLQHEHKHLERSFLNV